MPKPIPPGGKRTNQIKVNLNDTEFEQLEVLRKRFQTDRASFVRNCFITLTKLKTAISHNIKEIKDIFLIETTDFPAKQKTLSTIIGQLRISKGGLKRAIPHYGLSDIEIFDKVMQRLESALERAEKFKFDLSIEQKNLDKKLSLNLNQIEEIFNNDFSAYTYDFTMNTEVMLDSALIEKTSKEKDDDLKKRGIEILVVIINWFDQIFLYLDYLKDGIPFIVKIDLQKTENSNLLLQNLEAGAYALNANKYYFNEYTCLFTPKEIKINIKEFDWLLSQTSWYFFLVEIF